MEIEIGSIVTFEMPGSRETSGVAQRVPAIVLGQWPDGSLQLYAFHFQGQHLVQSIRVQDVDVVFNRADLTQRLADLEGTKTYREPKFSFAESVLK